MSRNISGQQLLRTSESSLSEPQCHGCPVAGTASEPVCLFSGGLHMGCHSAFSHCGDSLCLGASCQVQISALCNAVHNCSGKSALGGIMVSSIHLCSFPFFYYPLTRFPTGLNDYIVVEIWKHCVCFYLSLLPSLFLSPYLPLVFVLTFF